MEKRISDYTALIGLLAPQELLKQDISVAARKSRALQDITELSNKLKAEKELKKQKATKKNQSKVNVIETIEGEEVECESCKTKTTALMNCPTCKKQICIECAMTSIDVMLQLLHIIYCSSQYHNDYIFIFNSSSKKDDTKFFSVSGTSNNISLILGYILAFNSYSFVLYSLMTSCA